MFFHELVETQGYALYGLIYFFEMFYAGIYKKNLIYILIFLK